MNEQKIFEDYNKLMIEESIEKSKQTSSILLEVKKIITPYKFKKLKEFIYECDDVYNFDIVGKNKIFGDKQEEPYWFKYIYINQMVGYSGDDFYGTIFIPLPNQKYLKFNYNC